MEYQSCTSTTNIEGYNTAWNQICCIAIKQPGTSTEPIRFMTRRDLFTQMQWMPGASASHTVRSLQQTLIDMPWGTQQEAFSEIRLI